MDYSVGQIVDELKQIAETEIIKETKRPGDIDTQTFKREVLKRNYSDRWVRAIMQDIASKSPDKWEYLVVHDEEKSRNVAVLRMKGES